MKTQQFVNITTMRQVRLEVMTHRYDKWNGNQTGAYL